MGIQETTQLSVHDRLCASRGGLERLGAVRLVLSSRRATLNQINLSLTEISGQLRRMHAA
jgi:hypothetical protein